MPKKTVETFKISIISYLMINIDCLEIQKIIFNFYFITLSTI